MDITTSGTRPAIRFDRNELSGAFGDMGTDVPLIIGVALASHLDGASVLIMFGAMHLLAGLAFVIVVLLLGNRRLPAAFPVVALGLTMPAYRLDPSSLAASVGLHLPSPHVPQWSDIATGFVLLALPQIPLSLGNSVL